MTLHTSRRTVARLTVTASLLATGLSPLLLPSSAQAAPATASVSFGGQFLNYQPPPARATT